jgi:hypothetical protein
VVQTDTNQVRRLTLVAAGSTPQVGHRTDVVVVGKGQQLVGVRRCVGALTLMKLSKLTGKFPRDFELVPGEKFMIVGYETSHGFQVYSVDYTTGKLTPIAKPLAAYKPVCFVFGASR